MLTIISTLTTASTDGIQKEKNGFALNLNDWSFSSISFERPPTAPRLVSHLFLIATKHSLFTKCTY